MIFLKEKSKTKAEVEKMHEPTWRCLALFSLFQSLPHSNKFSQRRGTAPMQPGKEEQEEGDEREGWEEGEGGVEEEESEGEEGGL